MKSYCWDNKGKEETEKYEFVKKYAEWIENPRQGECPYSDPDGVNENNVKNIGFYTNITSFLNNRCKEFTDKSRLEVENIEFLPPTGIKKDEPEPKNRTIVVEGHNLYLTSDQFGFSANKDIYDEKNHKLNEKYPFVKYVKNGGVKSLVGDTIWNTRTIGGSFLWPKVEDNRGYWVSTYNTERGVGKNPVHVDDDFYIEDRVDLTLYEIKEFYEAYIESKDYDSVKKNMSKDSLILRYCDSKEIFIWLSLFGTFENYVNFFCFNDFVNNIDGKYYPKDIFSGESINNENIKEYRDKTGKTYKFIQRNACKEDLETAFINLIAWTSARSARMETIISNNDKKIRPNEFK